MKRLGLIGLIMILLAAVPRGSSLRGIRLNDTGLIMQGAVPAACLAILLQIFFELAERWFVPAGLRPLASGDGDVTAS